MRSGIKLFLSVTDPYGNRTVLGDAPYGLSPELPGISVFSLELKRDKISVIFLAVLVGNVTDYHSHYHFSAEDVVGVE